MTDKDCIKEPWFKKLLSNSYIGVIVVSKNHQILFANDYLCSILGYEKKELIDDFDIEVLYVSHESYLNFKELLSHTLNNGKPVHLDYQFKKKDGTIFWAHVSGDYIEGQGEILWNMVDITDRKKAQEELSLQYTILDTILNTTQDLIFYKDYINEDGKYIGCNEAFAAFKGKTKKEVIGRTDIELHGEKLGMLFHNRDKEILKKDISSTEELWVKWPNGKKVLLLNSVTPFKNKDGKSIGVVGIARDITKVYKKNRKIQELNERKKLALMGNNDGVWDWNLENNSTYFSPRWKEIIGYNENELANEFETWQERVHPKDLESVLRGVQENIDGKTDYYEGIHRLKHKNGSWVWILSRGKATFNEDGKAIRMTGTHTDVTKEKELQLKYKQQSQMLGQVSDSITITDVNGIVTYVNHGAEILAGYTADEMIGKNILTFYLESDHEKVPKYVEYLLKDGKYATETKIVTKSGKITDIDLSLSVLKDEKDNPIGYIGYSKDITEKKVMMKKLEEQKDILHYQAHHDALTGLPNRVLFHDRLSRAIRKAKRNRAKIALLFIDLDHFKEINDSLGHDAGDKVLKITTKRIQSVLREEDTLARLSGDEFTVIIEYIKEIQDTSTVADKILESLNKPIDIDNYMVYISASIGISVYPDDGKSAQNLLKFADSAMYKAKGEGRNNFQYYNSSLTELAFERVVMLTSLKLGLENREFVVYYQPQVDGVTDTIVGMEALVRWNHPTMGLVSPAKFIPLAESSGLIVELDRFVMRSAMTQIAKWYKEGLNPGILAMNLAVKQLEEEDFISTLKKLMKETGCKAEWLEFEVTESQVMTRPEKTIKILKKISNLGIELAIDDFGTGYSSLAYLKKLPIDKLKIDQAFVRDLPDDEEDSAIARAVIALAKSLNLKVIAEGVETKEQRDFMLENGCKNIQGYFYSKAIPADELKKMLKSGIQKDR